MYANRFSVRDYLTSFPEAYRARTIETAAKFELRKR